jgi:AAA+ ATPase superfamily predicted ATPase
LIFVNRDEELKILQKLYAEDAFQFVAVYGRRRIGKTRLIQEFIRNRPAIYFLADSLSESEQLKNLGREIGEYFQDRILKERGFADWYQFFQYLQERAGSRLILVVDEFPYLVNANPAISSIFQKGIDQYLKGTKLFLILMGSSIGMMEKEVLFYKAPLYGRRTASLEVKEMFFDSLEGFFPQASFPYRLAVYSVMGTIPAYLERIKPKPDIFHNIAQSILDRGSFLYNEVEFLLRGELREPRNYFVILRSIAQGKRKLSEIINDTGLEKTHLSRYLDILRSIRLVEKEVPVTEKYPDKSRAGLYKLHDRFFTFWFKYIFPNRSKLEIGGAESILEKIKASFEQHLSLVYEEVSRELCLRFLREKEMNFTSIGKWWLKNEEIDLVALDEENGIAYFGECKWSRQRVQEGVFDDLVKKSHLVDWHRGKRKDRFILFSKSGFTESMQKLAQGKEIILVEGEKRIYPK